MPAADTLWKTRNGLVLTAVLLVQGVLFYTALGRETIPRARPLDLFPTDVSGWRMVQEGHVEKEVQDVLRADDTLTRAYQKGTDQNAGLFVAYFKTQRAGQAPHSPKNCLPGSGWEPSLEGTIDVSVPAVTLPIRVNRYIVSKGNEQSVVLYWYQTRGRAIANEYAAKFWLVADSLRYHRSDTALVRVIVPSPAGADAAATRTGVDFVQAFFPILRAWLPE
jgi:EpsI family protein